MLTEEVFLSSCSLSTPLLLFTEDVLDLALVGAASPLVGGASVFLALASGCSRFLEPFFSVAFSLGFSPEAVLAFGSFSLFSDSFGGGILSGFRLESELRSLLGDSSLPSSLNKRV